MASTSQKKLKTSYATASSTSSSSSSSSSSSVTISVHKPQASTSGPLLGLFASTQPPTKTAFELYTRDGYQIDPRFKDSHLVVAETDEIEFESRNHLKRQHDHDHDHDHHHNYDDHDPASIRANTEQTFEDQGYSAQYVLGVHDPTNNTLTLHATALHNFQPSIKSLKHLTNASSVSNPTSLISAQRAALGATFGTKKAQRQLNAQARNRLDNDSFGSKSVASALQGYLTSSIQGNSLSLPSKDEIDQIANTSRSTIPKPNLEATKIDECYPLDIIVSKSELSTIDLDPYLEKETHKERIGVLPFRRSKFIADRIRRIFPSSKSSIEESDFSLSKKDQAKLRLLIYLSILFQFRQFTFGGRDSLLTKPKLLEKFGQSVSPIIIEGLLQRFTETSRSGSNVEKRMMTSIMEMKILNWILTICLRLDGYATDVGTIATDLGIGSKKIGEHFRSLGCHLLTPVAAERERLVATGIVKNASEARSRKQAVLRIPLEFPQDRKRAAKR